LLICCFLQHQKLKLYHPLKTEKGQPFHRLPNLIDCGQEDNKFYGLIAEVLFAPSPPCAFGPAPFLTAHVPVPVVLLETVCQKSLLSSPGTSVMIPNTVW
jgi:hypothetical protein